MVGGCERVRKGFSECKLFLTPAVTKGATVKGDTQIDHTPSSLAVLAPSEALLAHGAPLPWGRPAIFECQLWVVFTSMPIYIGMEVKTTPFKDFHQLFSLSMKHSKVAY